MRALRARVAPPTAAKSAEVHWREEGEAAEAEAVCTLQVGVVGHPPHPEMKIKRARPVDKKFRDS